MERFWFSTPRFLASFLGF
jgi:hypothetical protein